MSVVDDWELVAQAQAGDMAAFTTLVRRYQAPVTHFCRRMVDSEQDAEDLAQDCFVRLHRYLRRLEPRAKFSTVVFGIARNLALNAIRDANRRGRGKTQPLDAQPLAANPAEQPGEHARRREINALLEKGIAALTPAHREIIVLREIEGMDYENMAKVLKCRKGTVRSRLARAREQLRLRLEELGGGLL